MNQDEKELTEPLEPHFKFGKSQRKLTLILFSAVTQVQIKCDCKIYLKFK